MALARQRIDNEEKLRREALRSEGVYKGAYRMFSDRMTGSRSLFNKAVDLSMEGNRMEAISVADRALEMVPTETQLRIAAIEHPVLMFFRYGVSHTLLQYLLPRRSAEKRLHQGILEFTNELRDAEREKPSSPWSSVGPYLDITLREAVGLIKGARGFRRHK